MCQNIELFDEYVAVIFSQLYSNFPIRITLDATKISGHESLDEFGTPLDERGKRSRSFEVCMATIEWLIDTGYISAKDDSRYGYRQCVLTARGLEILKSVPESVQVEETIGEKIVYMLRAGSVDAAKEAAKAAISAGIGMIQP